ncbi:MAG: Holliday junction resolvase RuvX [Bacilli bacterium]|jgi:putative Holliday junction resolvase
MKYLGLDLGTKTLGIAISDANGIIANSYKTLYFKDNDNQFLLEEIKVLIEKEKIEKIVLGLPKNMDNTLGKRAKETLNFKEELESYLKKEVILEDERWTTKQAEKILLEGDLSRKKRKKRIDKLAATIILQGYLNKKNRKGD